jgi:hypothetical protein
MHIITRRIKHRLRQSYRIKTKCTHAVVDMSSERASSRKVEAGRRHTANRYAHCRGA